MCQRQCFRIRRDVNEIVTSNSSALRKISFSAKVVRVTTHASIYMHILRVSSHRRNNSQLDVSAIFNTWQVHAKFSRKMSQEWHLPCSFILRGRKGERANGVTGGRAEAALGGGPRGTGGTEQRGNQDSGQLSAGN
jgi:hypothetical protein